MFMIDKYSRKKLAEALRHFLGGFRTNFEYDDIAFDLPSRDHAVNDIIEQVWLCYDDLREHKLTGGDALNQEQLDFIKRCILFLKTDIEYKWPQWPVYYKLLRPVVRLFSLGLLTQRTDSLFNGSGDTEYWPFYSKHEYILAKENPVYLSNYT